jgi:hypothetical protein
MYQSTSPDDDISPITPNHPSPEAEAEKQDKPLQFNWNAFVPLVHPMKTAIVEAMCWVQEPLSANLLSYMTGGRYDVRYISYHVRSLAEARLIVLEKRRSVRGATERLYKLNPRLIE